MKQEGNSKKRCLEQCYVKAYDFVSSWKVQGLDSNTPGDLKTDAEDKVGNVSQEENVIIEGAETSTEVIIAQPSVDAIHFATTEEPYEFTNGESSIIGRWMPMATQEIGGANGPNKNEGLIASWKIFEDMANMDNINVLPLKGFMLGKYDLEFKMVLQTTPFQAMIIMLGYCPNPYGLYSNSLTLKGFTAGKQLNDDTIYPVTPSIVNGRSYLSLEASIQRPHVIMDVTQGGEATLLIPQKYQRTFVRMFDAAKVTGGNPGVRGGFTGLLTLHALTNIKVGSGTTNAFSARIFYRFSKVRVTAMTQPLTKMEKKTIAVQYTVPEEKYKKDALKPSSDPKEEKKRQEYRAKWRTQGPALSIMVGTKIAADTATAIIRMVENIGGKRDKRIRNQDKPNDAVHQIANVPRPRMNFTTGEGVDSACIVGLNWVELSKFLEFYEDEPKSYKDLLNIFGLLDTIEWASNQSAGATIWSWSAHPTLSAKMVKNELTDGLSVNDMNTPLQMVSSGFTNYRGTMHIYAQFAKTFLHKGAIEISITYARTLSGDAKENSYVKIINVQDCSGFHITVPYIFDTPMRTMDGTSVPLNAPNITWSDSATMFHSTVVTIRVLNQLIAPESVANVVPIVLYLKGGTDFVLNYPRPYNSAGAIDSTPVFATMPHMVTITGGITVPKQYHYITNNNTDSVALFSDPGQWVIDVPFETQGLDFNEPAYTGNIMSTAEHLNFNTILKQPVKILANFEYTAKTSFKFPSKVGITADTDVEFKNYISIPVAPLSRTFVSWLSSQLLDSGNYLGGLVQSHQYFVNTCFGQYSGGMMYTIIVDGTSPVYYAYAPHDKAGVGKLFGPLASWQFRAAGNTFESTRNPAKTAQFVPPTIGNSQLREDLASTGLFNGIIIPQVNPTEKIEVNQSIPQPWLLMNRDILSNAGGNLMSVRENSEWYNGRIYIWSDKDCRITVYQNNPDSFELGAFLGNPGFYNPFVHYSIDDNRRRGWASQLSANDVTIKYQVQGESLQGRENNSLSLNTLDTYDGAMALKSISDPVEHWKVQSPPDFRLKDLARTGWSSFKNFVATGALATTAAKACGVQECPIEYWAGAMAIYSATGLTHNLITMKRILDSRGPKSNSFGTEVAEVLGGQTTLAISNMSNVVTNAVECVATDLKGVSTEMIATAANSIKETITENTNGAMLELKNMVEAFFPHVRATGSLLKSLWGVSQHLIHCALAKTWANAGFAVFGILVELDLVTMKKWKEIGPKLEAFYSQAQAYVTQGPAESSWVALMHLLSAVICGKLQVRSSGGLQAHLKKIFWGHDYRSVSGLNAILSLTRTIFNGISTIVEWAFKEADPNAALLAAMHNQGVELEEFAADANEFLTFFADQDFNKRDKRIKYLAVILRAIKIRETMIKINDHKIVGPLMQICNKVIEKANSMQYMMKCDLVKQEPFTFCLEGDPEVGKSFSIYYLMPYLLKKAGIMMNTPDYIFTINCALDYFNGLKNDHIAWWFDDMWNLQDIETVRKMCNILYGVMTSAPYNVPRAELDNKEQLGQPIVMGMTTNNPFVAHPDLPCPQAIWRRRHNLAKLVLKKGQSKPTVADEDVLKRFQHLEVIVYKDVTDPASTDKVDPISFEKYAELLAEQFCKHLAREARNQKTKYEFLMQCMTKNAIDMLNIGNPFDMIRKANTDCEFGVTDSRQILEEEVAMLVHELQHRKIVLEKIPMNCDEFETQGLITEERAYGFERMADNFKLAVARMISKVKEWYNLASKQVVRCQRCGDKAHVSGVTMWCCEGAHYLCLACSTLQHQTDVISTLMCPIHPGSKVRVEVIGVVKSFISNYFADISGENRFLMTMISAMLQGDKSTAAFLPFLRILRDSIRMLSQLSTFFTQGESIGDEILKRMTEMEPTTRYYPIDSFAPNQNLESTYVEWQNLGEITCDAKYVCQHSMLLAKHICAQGKYVLLYDAEIEILDLFCETQCVLSEVRCLNLLKMNFETSLGMIELRQANDRVSIKNSWPRYLWPNGINREYGNKTRITQFLATDWWVEFKSNNPLVTKLLSKVLPVLAICGGLWAAGKVANILWKWIMSFVGYVPQEDPYEEEQERKRTRGKRRFFRTQGANFSNKLNKISGNYVRVSVNGKTVTGWGLKGSTFLLPGHLEDFVKQPDGFELIAMKCTDKMHIKKEHVVITKIPNKDLIMVTITKGRILFADCSKFLQKTCTDKLIGREVVIMEVDKEGVVDYEMTLESTTGATAAIDNSGRTYENVGGVMYPYQKVGLCGSLVCVDATYPVVAMHISGSMAQNSGIGVVLYQDDFEVQGESLYEGELEHCGYDYGEGSCLQIVGKVASPLQSYIPTKTDLRPSTISSRLGPSLTMPAYLTAEPPYPHDKSPLYYGIRKNGLLAKSFDNRIVDAAYKAVRGLMLSGVVIPDVKYHIYSAEEAICGLNLALEPGSAEYFGHIPMETSAGWPYTTNEWLSKVGTNVKNKRPWIEVVYGENGFPIEALMQEDLKKDHEGKMEERRRGYAAFNVFQDCLKDERRPIEKANKEGGTRLFSMSNIEGTIALRRYTLALVNHLRYSRVVNGSAIGINPESMEWNGMAVHLLKHPNYFTLDFANFGASLEYYTGMKFADLILDFYRMFGVDFGSADEKVCEALIKELMGSYHIAGSVLYKTFGGSPSGACITAEINSFVHLMYLVMCWFIIGEVSYELRRKNFGTYSSKYPELVEYLREVNTKGLEFTTEDFFANCIPVVYGDDGIYSVSDAFIGVFNAVSISIILGAHNLTVTNADKKKEIRPSFPFDECEFLKRKFVPHPLLDGFYASQMRWDVVEEMVKWIRRKPLTADEATLSNCESSLTFAFGHGEAKYYEWLGVLETSLNSVYGNRVVAPQIDFLDIARRMFPEIHIEKF